MWSEEKNGTFTSSAQSRKKAAKWQVEKQILLEKPFLYDYLKKDFQFCILRKSLQCIYIYSKAFLGSNIYKQVYWIDPGYLQPNWLRPPQIVITAALSRATHQSLVTFPNSRRAAWIFHLGSPIHRKFTPSLLSTLLFNFRHQRFFSHFEDRGLPRGFESYWWQHFFHVFIRFIYFIIYK